MTTKYKILFFVLISTLAMLAISASAAPSYWTSPKDDIPLKSKLGYNICSSNVGDGSFTDPSGPFVPRSKDPSVLSSYVDGGISVNLLVDPNAKILKYVMEFKDKGDVPPPEGELKEYYPDPWCAPKDPNSIEGVSSAKYKLELAKSNLFTQLTTFVQGPRSADPFKVPPPLKHFLKDTLPTINATVVHDKSALNKKCSQTQDPSIPRASCTSEGGTLYMTANAALDNELIGYELTKAGMRVAMPGFFKEKISSAYETKVLTEGVSMFFGIMSAMTEERFAMLRKGMLNEDGGDGYCTFADDARKIDVEYAECAKINAPLESCEEDPDREQCDLYRRYLDCIAGDPPILDPLDKGLILYTFPDDGNPDNPSGCHYYTFAAEDHACRVAANYDVYNGASGSGVGDDSCRYRVKEDTNVGACDTPEAKKKSCTYFLRKTERECKYRMDCVNAPNFEYEVNKKWRVGVSGVNFETAQFFGDQAFVGQNISAHAVSRLGIKQPPLQTTRDQQKDAARLANLLLELDKHIRNDVKATKLDGKEGDIKKALDTNNTAEISRIREDLDRSKYFYMAIREALEITEGDVSKHDNVTGIFLKNLYEVLEAKVFDLELAKDPSLNTYDPTIPLGTLEAYVGYVLKYQDLLGEANRDFLFAPLLLPPAHKIIRPTGVVVPGFLDAQIFKITLPTYKNLLPKSPIKFVNVILKNDTDTVKVPYPPLDPFGENKNHKIPIPIGFDTPLNMTIQFEMYDGTTKDFDFGPSKNLAGGEVAYVNPEPVWSTMSGTLTLKPTVANSRQDISKKIYGSDYISKILSDLRKQKTEHFDASIDASSELFFPHLCRDFNCPGETAILSNASGASSPLVRSATTDGRESRYLVTFLPSSRFDYQRVAFQATAVQCTGVSNASTLEELLGKYASCYVGYPDALKKITDHYKDSKNLLPDKLHPTWKASIQQKLQATLDAGKELDAEYFREQLFILGAVPADIFPDNHFLDGRQVLLSIGIGLLIKASPAGAVAGAIAAVREVANDQANADATAATMQNIARTPIGKTDVTSIELAGKEAQEAALKRLQDFVGASYASTFAALQEYYVELEDISPKLRVINSNTKLTEAQKKVKRKPLEERQSEINTGIQTNRNDLPDSIRHSIDYNIAFAESTTMAYNLQQQKLASEAASRPANGQEIAKQVHESLENRRPPKKENGLVRKARRLVGNVGQGIDDVRNLNDAKIKLSPEQAIVACTELKNYLHSDLLHFVSVVNQARFERGDPTRFRDTVTDGNVIDVTILVNTEAKYVGIDMVTTSEHDYIHEVNLNTYYDTKGLPPGDPRIINQARIKDGYYLLGLQARYRVGSDGKRSIDLLSTTVRDKNNNAKEVAVIRITRRGGRQMETITAEQYGSLLQQLDVDKCGLP